MGLCFPRRTVALMLAGTMVGTFAAPAMACRTNERYEPDKPFDAVYFGEGETVFRGTPVAYVNLERGTEVTFEVSQSYRGEERERWTAFWITTAFPRSSDLEAFKSEIGSDLVVILSDPNEYSKRFTNLHQIVHSPCHQPAMRSFAVMEPVLRQRGLID